MTVQMLKLKGERYVILREKDYQRLRSQAEDRDAQDRGDLAEARRRKARGPARPYAELRKKLGLT